MDVGEIPLTTNEDYNANAGKTFSPTMMVGAITFAKKLTGKISVGVNAKIIHEAVPRASATAGAFDIGIQYSVLGGIEGLAFGVQLKNIGSSIHYTGSKLQTDVKALNELYSTKKTTPTAYHDLPGSMEIGLAYTRDFTETSKAVFAGTFMNNNYGYDHIRYGVEYGYNNQIFLRFGYDDTNKLESEAVNYGFTTGFGFKYQLGTTDLMFDYVYRQSEYFDADNMFSFTVGF